MNGARACLLAVAMLPGAAAALDDPTRPYAYRRDAVVVVSPGQAETYRVSAIRIGETDRTAIVNNITVRPGDRVGSAEVVAIDADGVVLQQERGRIKVTLLDFQVKKAGSPAQGGRGD